MEVVEADSLARLKKGLEKFMGWAGLWVSSGLWVWSMYPIRPADWPCSPIQFVKLDEFGTPPPKHPFPPLSQTKY